MTAKSQPVRVFTPEEKSEILRLRIGGMAKDKLARMFSTGREKIDAILSDGSVVPAPDPPPPPPAPSAPQRTPARTTWISFRPSRGDFGAAAHKWWKVCRHGTPAPDDFCARCANEQ